MADLIYENDDGLKASLASKVGKYVEPIGAGTLRLCTAPTTMSQTNVLSDFSEATFPGYAAVALIGANWTTPTLAAHVASSDYPSITFTRTSGTGSQSITGWFLTDAGKTKLYACSKFSGGPFIMQNDQDQIVVTPTLTDESKN